MRWKPRKKVLVPAGFAVAAALVCGVYVWHSVPLMRFRPVRVDAKQKLWVSSEILTSEQADNVVAVLQTYGEPFRRADGQTVLITPALSSDFELVWNYTSKAGL